MIKKEHINIPNFLSFYRLLSFPFVLYFAFKQQENIFVILLLINLITDILDGLIARLFHLQTELGARLDSIADIGTYILAFIGIYIFKLDDFKPVIISFSVFISLFFLANILSLLKFKRFPSLHLYSWKIGGYIQGLFLFILFAYNFISPYYYFMIIWGIIAFSEHIVIQLIIPEMQSNLKGLYWVLKNKK